MPPTLKAAQVAKNNSLKFLLIFFLHAAMLLAISATMTKSSADIANSREA